MSADQPLAKHELGERGAFRLEQHVHVSRRDPLPQRDRGHGQLQAAEMLQDVGLDGADPRRTHAAAARDLGTVTRGAERHGDQVMGVSDGDMAQFSGVTKTQDPHAEIGHIS